VKQGVGVYGVLDYYTMLTGNQLRTYPSETA